MTNLNKLLDKAKERCSLPSDNALAKRLEVSRQLISAWRNQDAPIADDRIAQLAHLSGEEVGKWLVLIHGDQATGELAREWAKLAKRLGAAAAVVLAVALPWSNPANAESRAVTGSRVDSVYYVALRIWRRFKASALRLATQPRISGAFSF